MLNARLLTRLKQKKAQLDALRPLPASILRRLNEELAVEWTYNSNAIEGNTLTLRETRLILETGITIGGKSLREHFEVLNHQKAIDYVQSLVGEEMPFTAFHVRQLHHLVLKNIDDENAGQYRKVAVRIAGASHTPPDSWELNRLMSEWSDWLNREATELHPIERAALAHHRLVAIHPFIDGNGRTARLVMNLLLMREGYPPTIIIKVNRRQYYRVLAQADRKHKPPLVNFLGRAVEHSLTLYLKASRPRTHKRATNAALSFQGSNVLGLGFMMSPEEAQSLIDKDFSNAEVLFPYLNGQDLNTNPDQSPNRWIINFSDWPLQRGAAGSWLASNKKEQRGWLCSETVPDDYPAPVAADYSDCLAIVKEKVYPERARKKYSKSARERWWQYERTRPKLYQTIAPLRRVLVVALTSKYLSFTFVNPNWVYSHTCGVIAFDGGDKFAILQSTHHEAWARRYASSLETSLRYTPADVFRSFPFPYPTPQQEDELEQIGERYHEFRRKVNFSRKEGLTKTYNRFHSPDEEGEDIVHLRTLHVEMDQAVATAYGWQDVPLNHDFHKTAQGVRFTISDLARRELLGRLLELNHERYAAEVKAGLHQKKKKTSKTKRSRKKKTKETPQMSMF